MKIVSTPLDECADGLYLCRPITIDSSLSDVSTELLAVHVDTTSAYDYADGVREYRLVGNTTGKFSIEIANYTVQASGFISFCEPRVLTTTEINGYVAILDVYGAN